ncbi:MAG: cation diffusion facilitator family transporter [Spartobacteria bacterium]|nr:cation diffusion facilitator family transporter [Spartobacteria bacterium]
MNDKNGKEKRVLAVSAFAGLCFALLGVIWGVIADSGMLIFDGLYSLLSVFLSLISLLVAGQVEKKEDARFPFGRSHFEPMAIVFRSLVLIVLCIYSVIGAVTTLMNGGRRMDLDSAFIYSIISVAGSFALYGLITRRNRHIESGLLQTEGDQWMGDTLLSLGVLLGFGSALILKQTPLRHVVIYADPIMVIVSALIFIRMPLMSLIRNNREILSMSPDAELVDAIETIVADVGRANELEQWKVHVIKSGRELTIECNYLVPADRIFSIKDMDSIRDQITALLKPHTYRQWLNVSFTACRQWL